MKTTKTYEKAIKKKYQNDEKSGLLRANLFNLTRNNIRNVCLNIIDEGLSVKDEMTMKNYFKVNKDEDLRRKVKDYDIERFRPICNFLKGDTESIKSSEALELISIMIGFNPRPYNKYRNDDIKEEGNISEELDNDNISYSNIDEQVITVKPKNKNLFIWVSNASAMSKFFLFLAISSVIITATLMVSNQTKWMVWENNQYKEVKFDTEKYHINQLKLYKEERILNFKKIIPDCNTQFFKGDGTENLWYGKNKSGELEYFTDLGLHPETGRTLKKISLHMIEKYICETYK